MASLIGIVLFGYLLGSIPFGFLISKFAGIDIRTVGSGNIGATNVLRSVGKPYGYAVFFLDFAKGMVAVLLARAILSRVQPDFGQSELIAILAGVAAVVGHSYPIWLGFKGGKGVATTSGALIALMPLAAITVLAIWLIIFLITKFVSLASIIGALALPFATFAVARLRNENESTLIYFSICLAALIVWRHRSNISRLMKGTETGFRRK